MVAGSTIDLDEITTLEILDPRARSSELRGAGTATAAGDDLGKRGAVLLTARP